MYYFNLTSITPYNGEIKTIKFKDDGIPIWRYCLGSIKEDIDGTKWELNGYVNGHVLARRYYAEAHTVTNSYSRSGRWIPYKVEMVE